MITTERLNELIEQGATVVEMHEDGFIDEVELLGDCHADDYGLFGDCGYHDLYALFETKDHADWHRKMSAERIERFEPPMWEDIKVEDGYEFKFFDANNEYYAFKVIKNTYTVICVDDFKNIFEEVSTKENYIKACEIVRDLFNKVGVK